ncbi:MAG: chromosome segregation protein SMC [Sedimentisphaerales bacterium]|nr:chromosome segregation protein SMC [Sedimentisphaerales bacterium]
MQLKKVILYGFKSFADKTEFEFGDGVTVVVGPNGCGKSNVVDAIKWVLGEQSAKSLRGGQMMDVIFNGTGSRKSMGCAEVSLVFSNSRGLIAIDQEEIKVTRRLYRSGESEYLINDKPCRLRDIREMFMDTGVGADAYSIIEQGKVESLLQASKDDRRAIFEEAAGISKFKSRKKEAQRKLERTEQNVLRLTDIIAEVDKRLRSIRYQAGKARNYQTYVARLKELRLNQFLAEYHQLLGLHRQTEQQLADYNDELAGVSAQAQRTQTRLSELDHLLDQMQRDLHEADNEILQCTSQISNQQDRIDMGHRRLTELQEQIKRNTEQTQTLRQQIAQLQEQLTVDQQQLDEAQTRLTQQQELLQERQAARQQHTLMLNERRAQLDDEKSGLMDIVRRTAQLHNEISSLNFRRDNLVGQKDRLNTRSGQISTDLEKLLTDRAQLEQKGRQIQNHLEASQVQLDDRRQQLAKVGEEKLACSENLAAAKEHRSGLLSRRELLADMESRLEGVDAGVKHILEQRRLNPDSYYFIKGMVAELIRADVQYAQTIEIALSNASQHLVATTSQALLEENDRLEELPGRVRVICLDELPPFHDGYDFGQHPEVLARLIDVVHVAPDSERLAWHLLGKTVLVDTLDAALRLKQVVPAGYQFVTTSGELVESDGTVHAGPASAQTGLISRKSELRQLEQDITEADERIMDLQHQAEQYASQATHLEKNLQDLRTVIYETRTEEVETRSRLEQIDGNISRLKQEQPLIASEIATLETQIEEALAHQATSEQNLVQLQNDNTLRQQRVDALQADIDAATQRDQELLDEITDIKVQVGQTQQQRLALAEKRSSLELQLRQSEHTLKTLETDLTHARENYAAGERSILNAETSIAELFLKRQDLQEQVKTKRTEADALLQEKEQLLEVARQQRRRSEELAEKVHQTQMQANENRLREENLQVRTQEELNLDLAEAYQDYQHQEIDFEAVAAEIDDLRGKIDRLGNINLDAITEQEELEKRSEYLTRQLKDLEQSRRDLEKLIEKINVESEQLFRANFEAIRVNFSELFRKLFGGGRAEVVLEDPDNILECGIDIIARPPGKQLQSISLLSGGEKTMTAVALLMAIFKSKPSPFCLLDEVDAALDEANTERFTLVVRDFVRDSQFIIITHARRTMAIADIIYGVTMQEQGVSKKVSVRFGSDNEPVADDDSNAALQSA